MRGRELVPHSRLGRRALRHLESLIERTCHAASKGSFTFGAILSAAVPRADAGLPRCPSSCRAALHRWQPASSVVERLCLERRRETDCSPYTWTSCWRRLKAQTSLSARIPAQSRLASGWRQSGGASADTRRLRARPVRCCCIQDLVHVVLFLHGCRRRDCCHRGVVCPRVAVCASRGRRQGAVFGGGSAQADPGRTSVAAFHPQCMHKSACFDWTSLSVLSRRLLLGLARATRAARPNRADRGQRSALVDGRHGGRDALEPLGTVRYTGGM